MNELGPQVTIPAEQAEQLSMALMMLLALLRTSGGSASVSIRDLAAAGGEQSINFVMDDDSETLSAYIVSEGESDSDVSEDD